MALPVDFMERIVEWPGADQAPGYINAHWQAPPEKGPGMRGKPFKSLQEFMDFVQYAATKPGIYKELFFCLSQQRNAGRIVHNRLTAHRHADMATVLKALWLDVDVKPQQPDKAYTSLPEALDAIKAFVDAAGLPPPSALVFSGGGVHVYWISTRPLQTVEWKKFAEGLKAEAIRLGLKCDAGVTADAARVLRIPGTFNNKQRGNPRPVKLAHLGDSYEFTTTAGLSGLPALAPVTAAVTQQRALVEFELPPTFAAGLAPLFAELDATDSLAAGLGKGHSDMPLEPQQLFANCQHFKDSFLTHGAGQAQGLWMLTGLASTWLDDGRAIFHTLSKGYPSYERGETDKMYDRKLNERATGKLGWPSCKAFEGEGAKCKGCPFYGMLRSPLNLCDRQEPSVAPAITLAQTVATEKLDLPDGYVVNPVGYICKITVKVLKDHTEITEHTPLFLSRLRNFRPQAGVRKFIFETSLDLNNWGVVVLDEGEDFVNENTIIKALRKAGVKPNTKMVNNGREIITFMTSFMERLDAAVLRQQSVPFGWLWPREGGALPTGFAYGGELVMADGTRHASGFADPQLQAGYEPKGDKKPWWDLHDRIVSQHHPALECLVAASFGAPLQFATKQYNGTFCAWSPTSGSHKSTSVALGAAVWGNPKRTKEKPTSSMKGVLRKLGHLHNLPVFWDEINDADNMAIVAGLVSSITEGGDGSKLKSNREYYEIEEWQTLLTVCANTSLVATLQQKVKDTDAKLERVFEIEVEKRPDSGKHYEFDALVDGLNHNYGHMGIEYRNLLATNIARVEATVQKNLVRFFAEVGMFDGKERFRGAMAVAIYSGAQFANEIGCRFNLEEIWAYLKQEFTAQRRFIANQHTVGGSSTNVLGVYSDFLNSVQDNVLTVTSLAGVGRGKNDAAVYISGPNKLRPRAVHIRMSVAERLIDISKSKFMDWCGERHLVPNTVIGGWTRHWGASEVTRINLAVGSGLPGGARQAVIRIPVPAGSPFESDLFSGVSADQLPADYVPPNNQGIVEPDVTAAVTPLAAAAKQAAADLNTVRKAS